MKVFRGLPWVGFILAAPALASAQVTVSDETSDAQRVIRPRQTVTLRNGRGDEPTSSDGYVPEFHQVVRGDTLWDITGYYFTNPWRWPQVWGRNPQITNPHWIFPGDQVRLLTPDEARVVPAAPNARQSGTITGARTGIVTTPRVPRGTVFVREDAWVSNTESSSAGSIVGAPEDVVMLSEGDQVYVEFARRAPNIGEAYSIYEEGQGSQGSDRDGRVVRVLGTLVIDAWDPQRRVATARITESIDPIERGNRVAIVERSIQPVPPVPNDRDLAGHIVATRAPRLITGGQQVVIIDRGRDDGVRPGNRLFLTRRGDPWRQSVANQGQAPYMTIDRDGDGVADAPPPYTVPSEGGLPVEVTGEIIVVATQPHASTCLVLMSQFELELGQSVVMRRGY